ncbi:GntR family transcriptional regulator [Microbacteriaceae bacterium VKM Ac-2855]|nr:GntR family transcriptional regulator [Microbacteriaceae bacterium VKM Ac-2855]
MITLDESSTPLVDQIQDQIRGYITTGILAPDQRLPAVRQLASDLGIAPGTVAKAYRALENDNFLTSRIGSGTRVSPTATAMHSDIILAAAHLATVGKQKNITLEESIRVLRTVWPD